MMAEWTRIEAVTDPLEGLDPEEAAKERHFNATAETVADAPHDPRIGRLRVPADTADLYRRFREGHRREDELAARLPEGYEGLNRREQHRARRRLAEHDEAMAVQDKLTSHFARFEDKDQYDEERKRLTDQQRAKAGTKTGNTWPSNLSAGFNTWFDPKRPDPGDSPAETSRKFIEEARRTWGKPLRTSGRSSKPAMAGLPT